jgi:hypothetical protein
MRRLVVVAALSLVLAPAAGAKTLKVNWHESKAVGAGRVDFHVTKIVVAARRWSVTAEVANRSPYALRVAQPKAMEANGTVWSRDAGFGVAYRSTDPNCVPVQGCVPGLWAFRAATGTPTLPASLAAGATWSGTFSGTAKLPHRTDLRLTFGYFTVTAAPDADVAYVGTSFNWVTDHTFRT